MKIRVNHFLINPKFPLLPKNSKFLQKCKRRQTQKMVQRKRKISPRK